MEYLEMIVIVSCSLFAILFCFIIGSLIASVITDAIKQLKNPEVSTKDKISEVVAAFFMVLFFVTIICSLILIVNHF